MREMEEREAVEGVLEAQEAAMTQELAELRARTVKDRDLILQLSGQLEEACSNSEGSSHSPSPAGSLSAIDALRARLQSPPIRGPDNAEVPDSRAQHRDASLARETAKEEEAYLARRLAAGERDGSRTSSVLGASPGPAPSRQANRSEEATATRTPPQPRLPTEAPYPASNPDGDLVCV